MDSILPMGGFQLPFQKRLSSLYNDTKKSSDFVKESVQNEEDPEMKALHRKLRIQKDRLVSWGLEWSDPNQSAEIDESLSKAGLSEVVGSIMSTIKDILAEAEPLWLSSKRVVEGSRPSIDRKAPLIQWDKGRFEDLIRDLTASIDTLYDVSRTRSLGGAPRRPSKTSHKMSSGMDDYRPFESTRMQTPLQIDPKTLTHLRPRNTDGSAASREVVFMSKTAYSELTQGTGIRQPWAPLLLEYSEFDAIYSVTGITPPMARFEKLSAGLQQDPQRAPTTWTGLPRLLGYFEDLENSRIGLVYRFPPSFNAVSFERLTQNPLYDLPTLGDLLSRPGSEPPLEAKFRLAHNLTNTIFDMHARGVTHGNLVASNVCFCDVPKAQGSSSENQVDVRRPLVSSFDLFPEDDATVTSSKRRSLHPLDPRIVSVSPLPKTTDERVLELYSLAMLLLSIGFWSDLSVLAPEDSAMPVSDPLLEQLGVRCGSLYMKAVEACWSAVDSEMTGSSSGEVLLSAVQARTSKFLEACCILDGVSGLEQRLGQELQETETYSRQPTIPRKPVNDTRDIKTPSIASSDIKHPIVEPTYRPDIKTPVTPVPSKAASYNAVKQLEVPESRVRLYPHVPLSPETVDKWNTVLMPQINHALRHFYRKYPESVEISLESIGPGPHKTQPTVLVVCTSVGKVRAIIRKRIGDLFDGTTGFALKVCRGHVLRSRKHDWPAKRSMAGPNEQDDGNSCGDDADGAVNPEFAQRPGNGASIGAWIGDRHLPPVSFGGLVMVDDKPYGMTVHHMLDDPDRDFGHSETMRSSAMPARDWDNDLTSESTYDDDLAYELSDTESEAYSETDITSEYEDDDYEESDYDEPGDVPGIEPGCGDGYIVTQPALDDVEEGFYPDNETEAEDHLDTFSLGEVFASSGIKRKQAHGLVHEVDWALFEFESDRLPDDNSMPRAKDALSALDCSLGADGSASSLQPTAIASWSSLPGTEVQCVARTSGLQSGQILPALTSVKIYGRTSPSHTYQVASVSSKHDSDSKRRNLSMGIPGDSGAWVVDRQGGKLCGHVLAWSQRKHVAYICPMEVLLADIAETLEANEIRLPGGQLIVSARATDTLAKAVKQLQFSEDEDTEGEDVQSEIDAEEVAVAEVQSLPNRSSPPAVTFPGEGGRSASLPSATSPIRLERSNEIREMTSRISNMGISGRRIDVNG